jgi:LPS export ABC transporter protein LptC
MRKLPIAILACVVVFLAVVVGVLLTRSRGPRTMTPEAAQTKADYRIKEVHLQEEGRGSTRWQLDAEYGEIFEDQGRTTMKKVVVRVEEPARVWTVSADEGDMLRDSKDVELRGNVILETSDGLRLETSRLAWTAKDQRAWTDRPVTIYRSGITVKGAGLRVSRQRGGDDREGAGASGRLAGRARGRPDRAPRGNDRDPEIGLPGSRSPVRWP